MERSDPNLKAILKAASLSDPVQIFSLEGGANNRVFKLEFQHASPLVCKHYFQDPHDLRKRLDAEYSFLQYASRVGIENTPKPILAHPETNMALYSFSPGQKVLGNLTEPLIQQAVDFFLHLNRYKIQGVHLPKGSESCFSLLDYIQITEHRIKRLQENTQDPECQNFITSHLYPKWQQIKSQVPPSNEPLSLENSCISPSDFGFHNALLEPNGTLTFIDFEYAGWDDPCKTVCDFFCQPKVPIPLQYFPLVSQAMASVTQNPDQCLKRIQIIFPVMQIKWCCILLNIFTKVGKNRRLFSLSLEQKEKQLKLAKQNLDSI